MIQTHNNVHYLSLLKSNNYEANHFIRNFKKILYFLEDQTMRDKLIESNYFRDYAFENQYEFLSVITENYFETPGNFHTKLPEMFLMVNKLYRIYDNGAKNSW